MAQTRIYKNQPKTAHSEPQSDADAKARVDSRAEVSGRAAAILSRLDG